MTVAPPGLACRVLALFPGLAIWANSNRPVGAKKATGNGCPRKRRKDRKMNSRTKRLAITYALLLVVPGILPFCIHVLCRPHYISLGTGICVGIATLFGPWATLVAKCTNIPNAGEFFNPWLAVGLTVASLAVILISVFITKKWITVLCVGVFVPLSLAWLFSGFGQLASCIL